MATRFQVAIDCADPGRLTRFWATALRYRLEEPPNGFTGWNAYWRSIGVPEEELEEDGDLGDSLVDPDGVGPRVWFQKVPEAKVGKNRLHLDLNASGGRSVALDIRKQRVRTEAERLLGAGATTMQVLEREGEDHFAIVMQDPEGNEFCVH